MKTINYLISMLGVIILLNSCDKSEGIDANTYDSAEKKATTEQLVYCENLTFNQELTEADSAGIMLMREEEKMAHDLYEVFFEKYNLQVFEKISASEDMHMNAMLNLIEGYNLIDPVLPGTGMFSNEAIADLYNSLKEKGELSVEEALRVGAYVEEYDIIDLEELIAETKNSDIIKVYSNLLNGSQNHLRAFVSSLNALGITYTPQLLDEDYFTSIIESGMGNYGSAYRKGINGGGKR